MRSIWVLVILAACSSPSKWDNHQTAEVQEVQVVKELSYEQKIKHYHDSASFSFTSGANGVLLPEDLKAPKPLEFYPIDSNYRVKADFVKINGGESFQMQTSTDRLPVYTPYGKLQFVLMGDSLELTLYQSQDYPDYLFCPFKDLTNGEETYGAGRYLDFELADTNGTVIDFNICYNPLCAYNHNYSCPIPPSDNHLDIRIEAGVKKWH